MRMPWQTNGTGVERQQTSPRTRVPLTPWRAGAPGTVPEQHLRRAGPEGDAAEEALRDGACLEERRGVAHEGSGGHRRMVALGDVAAGRGAGLRQTVRNAEVPAGQSR